MSDGHEDFLNGLRIVEYELERVIGELDEMQDRREIPHLDRVCLNPLQWALSKLADDLHDVNVEVRNARLELASARRQASEAQQQLAQVTAQRDAAYKQLAKIDSAAVLSDTAAELTKKAGELPVEPDPEPYQWQVGDVVRNCGNPLTDTEVVSVDNGLVQLLTMSLNQRGWERCGWKFYRRASELGTQELTPTPDPSSDPYEWKVGDQIWKPDGFVTTIEKVHLDGTITLWDRTGVYTLEELRKHGWKLHRKASELGVQELTPQQVAGFAAVTEPIDDSVGTDEEGQS